jgi:hypothetical protein
MTDQQPTVSSSKRVRTLNAIQVGRIETLFGIFRKKDRPSLYINGFPVTDDSESYSFLALDRSDSKQTYIVKSREKCTIRSARKIGGWLFDEPAAKQNDHSVLDLFLTICKRFPEFDKASAKRIQKPRKKASTSKDPAAPIPYVGDEPCYEFGQSPLLDRSEIHPSALLNALAIGTIGSGKTASFIEPILFSMIDYRLPVNKTMSILVIDPKIELLAGVQKRLSGLAELERLVVIGQCGPIRYFQDSDDLSVNDRFAKVKSFFPSNSVNGDDNRWQMFAEQLILAFLRDDQSFFDVCGMPLLESVCALVTDDDAYLLSNQWVAMRRLLQLAMESMENLRRISELTDFLLLGVGMPAVERPLARYLGIKDGSDQFFYNARGAMTLVDHLGSPDIAHLVDFSVRRGQQNPAGADIASMVECGKVIVFQPRPTATFDMVGRALKALFFSAVMNRKDMTRPMAYLCDEFQRFVTCDTETGEHTFLDRCRAYRTNVILATQSIAALHAAVAGARNSGTALDSIMVNTPTKLCFRTPDEASVATLKSVIPRDPGGNGHILSCRPPSSLKTGECYYTIQDTWGRTRYSLPART